jgi:hypothetical protein
VWNTTKVMLRGIFIAISTYIKKPEMSQINILQIYVKLLEKQEQPNPKPADGEK